MTKKSKRGKKLAKKHAVKKAPHKKAPKKQATKKSAPKKISKKPFPREKPAAQQSLSSTDKEQRISKIEEGTVIDHITPETVFKVVEILKLSSHPNLVSIATNLPSKKMGKKAILKIEKRFLTDEEVNKISVFTPDASVSIIRNYQVKDKGRVQVPGSIENVIKCSNHMCVSNHEPITTKFIVIEKDPLKVVCTYCERPMVQSEIEIV